MFRPSFCIFSQSVNTYQTVEKCFVFLIFYGIHKSVCFLHKSYVLD